MGGVSCPPEEEENRWIETGEIKKETRLNWRMDERGERDDTRDGVKDGEEQRGKVNHKVSQGIILVWCC